jgi:hypothetical protein
MSSTAAQETTSTSKQETTTHEIKRMMLINPVLQC